MSQSFTIQILLDIHKITQKLDKISFQVRNETNERWVSSKKGAKHKQEQG